MEIKRLCTLALEIFKTLSRLNPNFMKNIFDLSLYSTHWKHDIFVDSRNTSNYCDSSLRAFGPYTWNSLSENIKSTTSTIVFKDLHYKIGSGLNKNVRCASR